MPLGASRIALLAKSQVTAVAEVIRPKVGVSAVGSAQVDTAQSYFGGASALFDGTGDYLTATIPAFGTEDFTVEGWVRSASADNHGMFQINTSDFGGASGIAIAPRSGSDGWTVYLGSGTSFNTNIDCVQDTWHHVAVVRNSGTSNVYIDGALLRSQADTTNYTAANLVIGGYFSSSFTLNGYVDEFRISNTARYTTAFTPATESFVNDANTLLLLHMDGTDASTFFEDDNGVRAKVGISAVGNAQVDTAQSQFGGASALFDGSDSLNINKNSLSFGTGDFTIEGWFRFNTIVNQTSYPLLLDCRDENVDPNRINIFFVSSSTLRFRSGTTTIASGTHGMSTGTWYHIAFVRNSGTTTIYINGSSIANGSDTSDYTSDNFILGNYFGGGAFGIDGHVDEFRVSNTARYTAGFTPSTTAFVNDADTLLLLHMDGTDASTVFTDDNGTGRSRVGISAVGNAQVDTSESKFGGASFKSDGTGDYLATADIDALAFGTGDFTMEAWIYPTATTNEFIISARQIISTPNPADTANVLRLASGKLQWSNGSAWVVASTTVTTNTWHHVAVSRSSGTLKIFLDGVEDYSATQSVDLDETRPLHIGAIVPTSSDTFQGWIDEVRVSNTARYTANFTAPTESFANDANTLLLLHMDGTDGSTTFLDDNGV